MRVPNTHRPLAVATLSLLAAGAALLSSLVVVGCDEEEKKVEDVEIVAAEAQRPPDVRLFKRSRPIMSTVFQIAVAGSPEGQAGPAVRAALDEIERLEDVLSEWIPESDISRINAAAGDAPVEVSEDAFTVVNAGMDVSRWSDGAFDLSWAALRGLYDFGGGRGNIPSRSEIQKRLPLIDWERIVLDDEKDTVFLRREGMAIGTGGIAKGYALDRAAEILSEAGLENYMLFAGGQVQVHGMRGDRAWRVGIQHPRRPDYFASIETTEGSISTSGDYEHFFVDDEGRRWHHILDPRTGLPVRGTMSVTVLAPNGVYGDALSTACFVLGPEKCLEMMEESAPEGAEAIIVDDEFRLHTTPGARDKLRFNMELDENGALPH